MNSTTSPVSMPLIKCHDTAPLNVKMGTSAIASRSGAPPARANRYTSHAETASASAPMPIAHKPRFSP
ncbi:MAG: hypothetical protein DWB42_18470 [Chloroflexi bacterium]|nr:hypothetical protein [Chloroflexota bacterium]